MRCLERLTGMRAWLVVMVALGLAACSDAAGTGTAREETTTTAGPQTYTASGTVLEDQDHGPQLCVAVRASNPPQCGGVDLVGWDWGAVDRPESALGVTWGEYSVVGTWDGERLTLTEPPSVRAEPGPGGDRAPDLTTPCDPPAGAWTVIDPATATEPALLAALGYAQAQPGYADSWVDGHNPSLLVLNLRFTGDLERHEAAVREVWGGSLCVSAAERTQAELLAIQDEVHEAVDAVRSHTTFGAVEVQVWLAEPGLQEMLDERYGQGVVEIVNILQPV